MATYTRPGVYVEETLNPLNDIQSNPGVSVAAFVGASSQGGPAGPTLIKSWSEYQSLYGALGTGNNDELAYAVFTYFANGGSACYVVRALASDATPASRSINGTQASPAPVLSVRATAAGTWAAAADSPTRVFVTITHPVDPAGATIPERFDLTIEVGSGYFLRAREMFTDLTMDPLAERNAERIVNSPAVGSKYVTLLNLIDYDVTPYSSTMNPATVATAPMTGGSDGTVGNIILGDYVPRLSSLAENLVINLPGGTTADVVAATNFASAAGRHFVVATVPKPGFEENGDTSVTAQSDYVTALGISSSYVAIYGPWVWIADPGVRTGSKRLTDPGGSVVGQYIHTDTFRGVFKAPAGVQTTLSSVVSPYLNYTDAQQDILVSRQINIIKPIPGSGTCIWGARTQSKGFPDRYVPIRRQLISIKSSLAALTRFAVFENDDPNLWALVEEACSSFLLAELTAGGLKGTTESEAFYVLCDASNNPPEQVAVGILNIEVGVALQTPAEFVIIRLGQMTGGTNISDSLDLQ